MNQMAVGSAIAAVAIVAGLWFADHIPRLSTIAADPEFVAADAEERAKDREFYSREITEIRLRTIADERGEQ
jgi:hypothetical protein